VDLLHLIHSTRGYRQYSANAISLPPLHTHYGSQSSLVVSLRRIYNSLSLQITHEVFFSQTHSFLAIILQLPITKTRLNSIPLLPVSYPGWLASRNSTLHSRLLLPASELFFITTLHGPRRKPGLSVVG
jgi:hypothetical protein